jgi:CheY-like chemotaxis protein
MSLKIMIVDDEPVSLQLMRSVAAPLYHTVLAFNDRQMAWQRAEKQRFDAVFVSVSAAQPDGFELAHRIRNSELNRECAIVALSATDEIEVFRRAFGEGADLVLTKPLTAGRLRPMLASLESAEWRGRRQKVRLPLFTEVNCKWGERQFPLRSLNISEGGMLLQPSLELEVGQEVSLEFKIAELRVSLNVRAHIVRKVGTEQVGVQFTGLEPEEKNAIQLYVMGHLREETPSKELQVGQRRLFR